MVVIHIATGRYSGARSTNSFKGQSLREAQPLQFSASVFVYFFRFFKI